MLGFMVVKALWELLPDLSAFFTPHRYPIIFIAFHGTIANWAVYLDYNAWTEPNMTGDNLLILSKIKSYSKSLRPSLYKIHLGNLPEVN